MGYYFIQIIRVVSKHNRKSSFYYVSNYANRK